MLDWSKPGAKYHEMAKNLGALMGSKSFPIVSRKDHPVQWREWYAYYRFRRMHSSMALMREKDEKTVPTISPFDFDAEFMPAQSLPEVPRDGRDERRSTPDERARLAAKYPGIIHRFQQAAE